MVVIRYWNEVCYNASIRLKNMEAKTFALMPVKEKKVVLDSLQLKRKSVSEGAHLVQGKKDNEYRSLSK